MKLPRIMISATSSGSGKTLVTCGLLQALVNRGMKVGAFKCGPDYIDPMFHTKVIGAKSKNLDCYFTDEDTTRYLFARTAREVDISVMEGVMGFYDGLSAASSQASSYEISKITNTPVILVVNCKGMSVSIIPIILGFLTYKKDSHIDGVILNQISERLFVEIKKKIEEELSIKVFGYVPYVKELVIESRHLGLVLPEEVWDYHRKLSELAKVLEQTLELDEILNLACNTSDLFYQSVILPRVKGKPRIAVAKDDAFCFYYEDNLQILKDMGGELIEFSPLNDNHLPEDIHGILLGGGYPELLSKQLSENITMRESIKAALQDGMPCIAECGGFMYLHRSMEDMHGHKHEMVGVIEGEVYKTNKLNRFGYIELSSNCDQILLKKEECIRGHEFHYFESTSLGKSMKAQKPNRSIEWDCIHGSKSMMVGFPHLYYYSNPAAPYRFLLKCQERMNSLRKTNS